MIKIADIETIYPIYLKISEFSNFLTLDEIKERIGNKNLCLIYVQNGEVSGFKIGYEKSEEEFYSWIGAVFPQHRRKGTAQKLLSYQEEWAADQGYKSISVKSMNIYPAMLKMLLNNNYRICDVTKGISLEDLKIHFTKNIHKTQPADELI